MYIISGRGSIIQKEHDTYMVNKFLTKISREFYGENDSETIRYA